MQFREDAAGQGAAFERVSARAEFIQQDQGPPLAAGAQNVADVLDMRGESAQIGLERLLVADVSQDGIIDREQAFSGSRHWQAALRCQAEQADCLQGDGFAAGVGAGDDQSAGASGQFQV